MIENFVVGVPHFCGRFVRAFMQSL